MDISVPGDEEGDLDVGVFQLQGLVESEEGVLGGAVGRAERESEEAGYGGGHCDVYLLGGLQVLLEFLDQVYAAEIVYLHQLAVHRDVAVQGQCPLGDAGVEHEEVRRPETEAVHILDQCVDGSRLLEIHLLVPGLHSVLAAALLHFLKLLLAETGQDDICPSLCELIGDRLADARAPARNQQGPVLELYHIRLLISIYKLTENTVTAHLFCGTSF